MKVLIVEDETDAAFNLRSMLKRVEPATDILGVTEGVSETVEWLETNPSPDLIFMDIHLADGDAFRIFDKINVQVPIIFATAYDEYALEAFKVNSIDYILKPIKESDLKRAIDKFKLFTPNEISGYVETVNNHFGNRQMTFLVYVKDKLMPLKIDDIAFFYIFEDKVWAYTFSEEKFPLDKSLDNISNQLDDMCFFRANRQFIVAREAIKDMNVWFGSRLSLNLKVKAPEKIIISRAKVPEFKRWLSLG